MARVRLSILLDRLSKGFSERSEGERERELALELGASCGRARGRGRIDKGVTRRVPPTGRAMPTTTDTYINPVLRSLDRGGYLYCSPGESHKANQSSILVFNGTTDWTHFRTDQSRGIQVSNYSRPWHHPKQSRKNDCDMATPLEMQYATNKEASVSSTRSNNSMQPIAEDEALPPTETLPGTAVDGTGAPTDVRRSLSKSALELARQIDSIENEGREEGEEPFDWFGGDKETEEMLECPSDGSGDDYDIPREGFIDTERVYARVRNGVRVAALIILALAAALRIIGGRLGGFHGVPLEKWSMALAILFLLPFLLQRLLTLTHVYTSKYLTLRTFDIPEYLHRVRNSIVFLLTTCLSFLYWRAAFPTSCPDDDIFCLFHIIPKVYKCAILLGMAKVAHSLSMQYISIKFNERAFKKRLLESRFKLYVIDHLREYVEQAATPSHITFRPLDYSGHDESDALLGSRELGTVEEIVQLAEPSVPTSTRRLSTRPGDFGLFRRIFQSRITSNVYKYACREGEQLVMGSNDIKAQAKQLFETLCPQPRTWLLRTDFGMVFQSERALSDAFSVFDLDEDGRVTRAEFRDALLSIYSAQKYLAHSIRDTQEALDKLGGIIFLAMVVVLCFFFIWIFGLDVYSTIGVTVSVVLSLNLSIAEPLKNFLLSVIFLFIFSFFTVGDRVIVSGEDVLMVRHIELLSTRFVKWNGHETYIPNYKLYSSNITNLSRSLEQWESVDFELPLSTAEGRLDDLRDCMRLFVDEHREYFYPNMEMRVKVAGETAKTDAIKDTLTYTARIRCRYTQLETRINARHSKLMRFLRDAVREISTPPVTDTIETDSKEQMG